MLSDKEFRELVRNLYRKLLVAFCLMGIGILGFIYIALNPSIFDETPNQNLVTITPDATEEFENGIHIATGFVDADGVTEVIQNCTNCHSAKLVTQNRMTREGWVATIRWMQDTQNLWDLGEQEDAIVNYLSANYAPKKQGRRQQLTDVEWYALKE